MSAILRAACCLQEVENVEIDQGGTYKYVLLRLQSRQNQECSKLLVRGSQTAGYHRDIMQSEQQNHSIEEIKVSTVPV